MTLYAQTSFSSVTEAAIHHDFDLTAMAAMNFEPWSPDKGITPDGLERYAHEHIKNASRALRMLYETKEQLGTMAETDEDGFVKTAEAILATSEAFAEMSGICKSTVARMLVAAAVIAA